VHCRTHGTKVSIVYQHLLNMWTKGNGPVHRKLLFLDLTHSNFPGDATLSMERLGLYLLQLRRYGYAKSDGYGHWEPTSKPWVGKIKG
jgi:hypothetical protein